MNFLYAMMTVSAVPRRLAMITFGELRVVDRVVASIASLPRLGFGRIG